MPGTDRSIADVLGDIAGNVQHIVRAEVRLAKAELREDLAKARRTAVLFGAGAVMGGLALGFALLAATYALATVVAPPIAALIVAAGAAVIAFVCISVAKRPAREIGFPKTVSTIQENVQWAKTRGR